MSIIDHIGIPVTDMDRARAFYVKALAPLGINELMAFDTENGTFAGYGILKPDFWLAKGAAVDKIHVAFAADSRAKVDAFYEAALAAGGRDNGAPGPRPIYHENYYGAFVLDPDGHNIEAVCHSPA